MSTEERDVTSTKKSNTPTFQSIISTTKISEMVLDKKNVKVLCKFSDLFVGNLEWTDMFHAGSRGTCSSEHETWNL